MRNSSTKGHARLVVVVACLLLARVSLAQTGSEAPNLPEETPSHDSGRGGSTSRPDFNLYLPEGEFDLRVRRLIRNVLFEGQVKYKFVDGDVSTFLRYKYYARSYTYRLGVFDSIEFGSIESSSEDFERTRGALLLLEVPVSPNRRYLALIERDALAFGDVSNVDHDLDNIFVKLGVLVGTPFDERLNALVGEKRGRTTPVLTAYREFGPYGIGFGAAVTHGLDTAGGDFDYTKLELEGVKKFDLARNRLIVTRFHFGTMLRKDEIRQADEEIERYSTPGYEYFRLGGRDALKGVDDGIRGSDKIHVTNEYFFPIFLARDHKTWKLSWNELYGVAYVGAGNVGFSTNTATELGDYIVDAGLGVEAALRYRSHRIYLAAVFAQTVVDRDGFSNNELRFSVRTSR